MSNKKKDVMNDPLIYLSYSVAMVEFCIDLFIYNTLEIKMSLSS